MSRIDCSSLSPAFIGVAVAIVFFVSPLHAASACSTTVALGKEMAPRRASLNNRVLEAAALNKQGRFGEAITLLEPLLASRVSLPDAADIGAAWNVLGLAYESRSNYDAARRAYENSIAALRSEPGMKLELASAVDNLGSVYLEMHEPERSKSLRTKARSLYREQADHAGMARASGGLALIALIEARPKEADRDLNDAFCQIKLVSEPDHGELAALYSIRAALSSGDGDLHAALTAVNRAIEQWNEDMPAAYMLPVAYSQRSQIEEALGNHSDARNDLQLALTLFRTNHNVNSPAYYLTEIAYAHAMRSSGSREDASRFESEAQAALQQLQKFQCADCTISAYGFQ